VRFEVPTVVQVKVQVFRDVTSRRLIHSCPYFGVSCCLLLQGLAKLKEGELGSLSIHIAFPSSKEPDSVSTSLEQVFFYERPFHNL